MTERVFIPRFDTRIIVSSTRGCMDAKFSARPVESIGLGHGDTVEEAARSLIACIRKDADEMEAAINKHIDEKPFAN